MLTIKAPIELKCDRMMVSSSEAFCHRITDNYQLIAANITGEDLLHLVTAPPEVYLGEGGMTGIVNNTQINNIQQNNLEVINSLMNRIAITEDMGLTYQDRVYITDVLHKLGIKNVQEFMTQVERLKQETNMSEQLISLYWNHADEMSWLVEAYQSLKNEDNTSTEEIQENSVIHLHEDIMNRLQTGALYQILSNFYAGHAMANTYVTQQELQITEQKRIASQILLARLKNAVQDRQAPLVYRHDNYYEDMELDEVQVNSESVNTQITSAVLLSLIDSLYFSRFERRQQRLDTWLSMHDAFYQSAQNTIYRLRMEAGNIQNMYSRREISVRQQNLQRMELFSTMQLLEQEPGEEGIIGAEDAPSGQELGRLQEFYERVENYLNVTNAVSREAQNIFERVHTAYREPDRQPEGEDMGTPSEGMRQDGGQPVYNQEITGRLVEREYQTEVERSQRLDERYESELRTQQTIYRETDGLPEGEAGETAPEYSQPREATAYRQEILDRLLSKEQENTVERVQRLEERQERIIQAGEPQPPGEAGDSYTYIEEAGDQPPQARPVEAEEQLAEQLRQINEQNIQNYNKYMQLLAEREERAERRSRPSAGQRREDSLLALQNPEILLERQRQERQAQESRAQDRTREIIELLPEQTRRIYERLEQYRENPGRFQQPADVTRDSIGLLMRDIHEIEQHSTVERQQLEQHDQERLREVSESVLERWHGQQEHQAQPRRRDEYSQTDMELVHKSAQNMLDEEILQELMLQNRQLQQRTQVTENVQTQNHTVSRTVQEVNRQTHIEQENINELIQQGIRSQLRPLSEQVYSRLEKRLQNEKRRRGY